MSGARLASVSIDLDGLVHYARLHGLGDDAVPDDARALVFRRAVPRFLELLEAVGARGTLFVIGSEARDPGASAALRDALARGHELASHSEGHDYALSRRDEGAVDRDLAAAESLLASMGAPRPFGFRAPGYTLSPALGTVLARRGYAYDASVFPAAPYWTAKALAMAALRVRGRRSSAILDHPRVLVAPRLPYRPDAARPERRGDAPFLELPVTVTPGLRLPFIGTFVVLAPAPLVRAATSAVLRAGFVSLELHAVDLLGPEDGLPDALCRTQPDLALPLARKLDRLRAVVARLTGEARCVPLAEAARTPGLVA